MPQVEAIFFDAAGTLFGLRESVGATYARIAKQLGVAVEAASLNTGFRSAWKSLPPPDYGPNTPSPDDDRGWWKNLVALTFKNALSIPLEEAVLAPLFDDLFSHFAKPAAWQLFDDVPHALSSLQSNFSLHVLSNFDSRLHGLLKGLGIASHFSTVTISSEVGASKPDRRIFAAALAKSGVEAAHCLHVGDDVKCDVQGAERAGIQSFLVKRPEITLANLTQKLFTEDI